MQADQAILSAWGIAPGYHDITGRWIQPEPETVRLVLEAMGAEGWTPPPPSLRVVQQGTQLDLGQPHELTTEDGAALSHVGALPPDLPPGYHRLRRLADGATWCLVVSPGRCYLPDELRAWGWAVQLYAVRSRASWGFGDLADLRELAGWSSRLGAGVILLNPLHAALPTPPQQPSPYYPSSRRFRNPLYIRVEEVPGATRLGARLSGLARAGRDLNASRLIDRD